MSLGGKISAAQRAVLGKLAGSLPADWYLAGGVGVAAHLDHRPSRDLDLFAPSDPTLLQDTLDKVPGVSVQSRARGTLYLQVDGVPVSLIEYRYPTLDPPKPTASLPVPVASVTDLACMKLSAIASRGTARDFWDLYAIIEATGRTLSQCLDDYRRKFPVEDLGHVIRSLAYFGDAEAAPLPAGLDAERWSTIRRAFEQWVPALLA